MSEKVEELSALANAIAAPRPLDEDAIRYLEGVLGEKFPQCVRDAYEAFRREFTELFPRHRGKWVAYHGSQRVGIGRSHPELYQECLSRGLSPGTFLVLNIHPEPFGSVDACLDDV